MTSVVMSNEQFNSILAEINKKNHSESYQVKSINKNAVNEKVKVLSSIEQKSYQNFFKAVLNGDELQVKELAINNGDGKYLAPMGFRNEIIAKSIEESEILPRVNILPVNTDTGYVPSMLTNLAVNWGGLENASFNEINPRTKQISWSLKRADAFIKLSRELVSDASEGLVEFLIDSLKKSLVESKEKVIISGNGKTEPEGILKNKDIKEINVGAAISYKKLVEIEQSVKKSYRKKAVWIMSNKNLRNIYQITDAQERPIFTRDVLNGNPLASVMGYQVIENNNVPDDTIIFGDLSGYVWFDREEMGIESTTVAGNAFEKHQVWIKIWERADGKLVDNEAVVKAVKIS